MMRHDFSRQLQLYGPEAAGQHRCTAEEAEAYCWHLASTHYENFPVVSRLVPRRLQQHLCNIYAFCRWADDLADETNDPAESLRLLDWWQQQLDACYEGQAVHPVFVALARTIRQHQLPRSCFVDLIEAFRQDQQVTRYETFDQLLAYCRKSANPVGRLVLYLCDRFSEANAELSDSICTGLQLANFCQDVAEDYERGRIYLPQETCRKYGYEEAMFAGRVYNEAFQHVMRFEVDRAATYLEAGWPLVEKMPRDMRVAVELFIRGGLAILKQIRRLHYDVWTRRPRLSKWTKRRLFVAAWWRWCRSR